eukprot:s2856_g6.t1
MDAPQSSQNSCCSSRSAGPPTLQQRLMAGYVLVHVLEVLVPGKDLGDAPSCEVALADATAQCPVPSTLEGENIVLPIPLTDADPVIYVRARDSDQSSVGLVVVPVNALVPMEIWNVWYAMDDGTDEVEKPDEEIQLADFLLRALQQLNAALEAKARRPSTSVGAGTERRRTGATPQRSRSGPLRPLRAAGALGSGRRAGNASGGFENHRPGASNNSPQSGKLQEPLQEEDKEERQKAKEEAFKLRLAPYERAIAALEEKQRLYDDQETRIKVLSKSLEDRVTANYCRTTGISIKHLFFYA